MLVRAPKCIELPTKRRLCNKHKETLAAECERFPNTLPTGYTQPMASMKQPKAHAGDAAPAKIPLLVIPAAEDFDGNGACYIQLVATIFFSVSAELAARFTTLLCHHKSAAAEVALKFRVEKASESVVGAFSATALVHPEIHALTLLLCKPDLTRDVLVESVKRMKLGRDMSANEMARIMRGMRPEAC